MSHGHQHIGDRVERFNLSSCGARVWTNIGRLLPVTERVLNDVSTHVTDAFAAVFQPNHRPWSNTQTRHSVDSAANTRWVV